MKHIAIIGAGIAGLTAAYHLSRQGMHVTVFDKSRGSGGRLASKTLNGITWDMGAQFIEAHSPAFAKTLQHWQAKGWIDLWPVDIWQIDAQSRRPLSDHTPRYVGTPKMTQLSRGLLSEVHAFVPATRIVEANFSGQWRLKDEAGQAFDNFDALIISTPPPQALPLLPNKSPWQTLIGRQVMQPCWTLLLSFAEQLPLPFEAASVQNSPISWLVRNSSKPDRGDQETWVIQASHDWSTQQVDSPHEQVQQALLAAFCNLAGIKVSPETQWLHRWLYAQPAVAPEQGALPDMDHCMVVCGDWCQRGDIEGAWESGLAAARLITHKMVAGTSND